MKVANKIGGFMISEIIPELVVSSSNTSTDNNEATSSNSISSSSSSKRKADLKSVRKTKKLKLDQSDEDDALNITNVSEQEANESCSLNEYETDENDESSLNPKASSSPVARVFPKPALPNLQFNKNYFLYIQQLLNAFQQQQQYMLPAQAKQQQFAIQYSHLLAPSTAQKSPNTYYAWNQPEQGVNFGINDSGMTTSSTSPSSHSSSMSRISMSSTPSSIVSPSTESSKLVKKLKQWTMIQQYSQA